MQSARCADLALFGGEKNLSLMIRQLELELTVRTLTVAISVRLSEKCTDILTKDRFMVKPDHLVFQVKNTTTVCYTKHNRGYKPKSSQSSWCDVYEACTLTAQGLPGPRQHLQAFHAKGQRPRESVARGSTAQPSRSSPCAEAITKKHSSRHDKLFSHLRVDDRFHLAPSSPEITVRGTHTTLSGRQDFVPRICQRIDRERDMPSTDDTTNLGLLE